MLRGHQQPGLLRGIDPRETLPKAPDRPLKPAVMAERHSLFGSMAEAEINAFLTHLAVEGRVSPSTQTQALGALLFLYRHDTHVLNKGGRGVRSPIDALGS